MPPPQIFSLVGHAYGLTVSGVQIVDVVPTSYAPMRWTFPCASDSGGLSFVVEDEGGTPLPLGSVVRLTDNVNAVTLFAGVLVSKRTIRRPGAYRAVTCQVAGLGWFLDNRTVLEFGWHGGAPEALFVPCALNVAGIMARDTEINASGRATARGSASDATARGVVMALSEAAGTRGRLYVDVDGWAHYWTAAADEATVVGTATSIGDEGTHQPENLTYEDDEGDVAHVAYMRNADGSPSGQVGNPNGSAWDAGTATIVYQGDTTTAWMDVLADEAKAELTANHSPLASITFSTTEVGGWRPHQAITIDDSVLTGSVAETRYIETVTATLSEGNVIEYDVTVGAQTPSFVRSVVGGESTYGGELVPGAQAVLAAAQATAHRPTVSTT